MTLRYKVLGILAISIVLAIFVSLLVLSHDSACAAPPALAAAAPSMNAMVYRCYGPPAVVKLERIAKPAPAADRILIKVAAASVNPLDWHYMRGQPYFMRTMAGVGVPEDIRLGVDFAGTVEAVGKDVTRFKPGDEVFGGADGSFAEYVTPREKGPVALKPANLTFEQAAAVPIAAVTALQALRDKGEVRAGQKVLINGASGGVGTFAVQIAKIYGAKVTGVCSTNNVAMVRAIGATQVIDYTQQDFTQLPERYDLIVDNVGNHSQAELRRVLTPQGRFIAVGGINCGVCLGPLLSWLGNAVVAPFHAQKRMFLLADLSAEDLDLLGGWMQSGKLTPVIDRTYDLNEVPAALGYLEKGHARGKVIVRLQPPNAVALRAEAAHAPTPALAPAPRQEL